MQNASNQNKTGSNETNQPQTKDIPDSLITKKELAKRLCISQRKIELDSKIPCIRWDRTVRYDWREVVEYLKGKREDEGE